MTSPIDNYLSTVPKQQRAALQSLRRLISASVPSAEEVIRTRVPALRYKGKTVVGFGAAKSHVALYVMFGNALRVLRDELAPFDVSRRVVRFTPDKPLPPAVVRKLIRLRLAEIDAQVSTTSATREHTRVSCKG